MLKTILPIMGHYELLEDELSCLLQLLMCLCLSYMGMEMLSYHVYESRSLCLASY